MCVCIYIYIWVFIVRGLGVLNIREKGLIKSPKQPCDNIVPHGLPCESGEG